jgi:hypothetical protein
MKNKFNILFESYMSEISEPEQNLRNFEFCLQMKTDLKTFTTVKVKAETGNEAYQQVINEYPNWRVYSWGEFIPEEEFEKN